MASNLDSVAVFEARALEIGLSTVELERIRARQWNTLGKLAFSCNYIPGVSDDSGLMKLAALITGVTSPSEVPDERMPIVRRLFFEAYTLAASDMRQRSERKEDDPPRKLALAERVQRSEDQQRRLGPAVSLEGELEPSHALIDLVVDMFERNELVYIRWEQCTKRDMELLNVRLDPIWKPDSMGVVRETQRQAQLVANTSTDLLLRYALQRRSLALDQFDLIPYQVMEMWSDLLLQQFLREPPAGHKKVTLEQLHMADFELFKAMQRATRKGIRPTSSGVRPMEQAFHELRGSPEVRLYLQPLPGGSSSSSSGSKRCREDDDPETARLLKRVANLENRLKNQSSQQQGGGGKQKGGKGNRSGKKANSIRMPPELMGMEPVGSDGQPRCFGFNSDGCKGAKPGQRCNRGLHVCMRPGCGKAHSQRDH